jgi:hypothetical protein
LPSRVRSSWGAVFPSVKWGNLLLGIQIELLWAREHLNWLVADCICMRFKG